MHLLISYISYKRLHADALLQNTQIQFVITFFLNNWPIWNITTLHRYKCYKKFKKEMKKKMVELSFPVVTSMHLQYILPSFSLSRSHLFPMSYTKNRQNVKMMKKKKKSKMTTKNKMIFKVHNLSQLNNVVVICSCSCSCSCFCFCFCCVFVIVSYILSLQIYCHALSWA